MDWEEKTAVKKGNIGEDIVRKTLEDSGYIVHKSITNKAHAFDFFAIKNKRKFKIVEVKSYARFNKFEATGIDAAHLKDYLYIIENLKIDVVLFFVDEHPKEERVYCQDLTVLMQPKRVNNVDYPNYNIARAKVLFSLADMKHVCKLSAEQLRELRELSSRKYKYK